MPSEDEKLIEGLRNGDETAFSQAVSRYSGVMLATAMGFLDRASAEDVVQESWLAVVDAIHNFEGRSALKTWLCTIVANRSRNRIRKHWRESSLEAAEESLDRSLVDRFNDQGSWSAPPVSWDNHTIEQLIDSEDLKDCLDHHIQKLPEKQRAILTLRELQQLEAEDICQMLDISYANLRTGLHRARQRLMVMVDHFRETGEC